MRIADANARFPLTTDITILPTTAWNECEAWNIEDLPNNLRGRASEQLGAWLISRRDWPRSATLPKLLKLAISEQGDPDNVIWVPGLKAAVAWLFAFLTRFVRYQVWPNIITLKHLGDPAGVPDYRNLGFFGLEAAYTRIRIFWNKAQR